MKREENVSKRDLVIRLMDEPHLIEVSAAMASSMFLVGLSVGILLYPLILSVLKGRTGFLIILAVISLTIAVVLFGIVAWRNRRLFM